MESALYNTTLADGAHGKSFFYVNPLEVVPEACHRDERSTSAGTSAVRLRVPPVARMVESVQQYAYTVADDAHAVCTCIWVVS